MKRNKSLQYLLGALITFVIGIVSVIVIAVALFGMSTPVKNNNNQVVDIIDRTVSVVGVSEGNELAKSRVSSGVLSVGDYLIRSFTSADYLMLDKSDAEFATDLVYVLYGESDKGTETDILNYLDGHTRMYAINEASKDANKRYGATSDISDKSGDSFENCVVTSYNNGSPVTVSFYDMEKAAGKDPYEMYLNGSDALLTIENPNAETDRELILFRDSFGSSIAPLLDSGYSRITLIDLRYIKSDLIKNFVSFENQDVLFLYSTLVLNNTISQ